MTYALRVANVNDVEKLTPLRSLAEYRLSERGTDLASYVRSLRTQQGLSWRDVAERLEADHEVKVHWTLLHRWFRDEESAA